MVTDPYDRGAGFPPLRVTADIVSVSHAEPNHSASAGIASSSGAAKLVDGPGEYEIGGTMVTGVQTYRDTNRGKTRGRNTAFLFEIDDISICHLGGLGHSLTTEQLEEIQGADVLLIPVDGTATLNSAKAVEVVSQIEPKIVVPMLHASANGGAEAIGRFCKEMAADSVEPIARLSVTKSSLPEETQVVLLTPPEARR